MRAIGLDVGTKTIGVAMTDEASIAAHPLTVLERAGNVRDAATVAAMVKEHGVTDVVVGLPLELSGKVGLRARRVRLLVDVLKTTLTEVAVVHEQDERFSTAEAERMLLAADVSRAKRKSVIDQHAAAIILATWLDTWRAANKHS